VVLLTELLVELLEPLLELDELPELDVFPEFPYELEEFEEGALDEAFLVLLMLEDELVEAFDPEVLELDTVLFETFEELAVEF